MGNSFKFTLLFPLATFLILAQTVGHQLFGFEPTNYCDHRVVGYYPDYAVGRLPIADISYEKLTHINYFSIATNADGSLDTSPINLSRQQTLVNTAHVNGVKVAITVGGWGLSTHFPTMAANPVNRANFISNLTQFCLDNNFDGADLDWEPVSNATDRANYTTLIQELKTALSPHNLTLSVALAGLGSEIYTAAISSLDWVNIMAYDMGTPHSSFPDAINTLNHWENFGFERKNLNLGVPFYGRDSSTAYTYKYIIDTYSPSPDVDLVAGINFNGINTIEQKAEYVLNNNYGGIMIWEISQDTFDHTSLLTTISSSLPRSIPSDFNCDGFVNLLDLSFFLAHCPESPCNDSAGDQTDWCYGTDLNQSGSVNGFDFDILADNWLKIIESDLIAHWKLDESSGPVANDSAGNDYDGDLINSPTWQPTGGQVNGALELDGVDQYVDAPYVLNPADGPFTACVWVKGGQPDEKIICQTDGNGIGRNWLNTPSGYLGTNIKTPSGSFLVSTYSDHTDGDWHHVAVVWDGSRRYLYADGVEVAADPADLGAALESCDGRLFIGAHKSLSADLYWTGLIDDLRIYNRALTTTEIDALANLPN